MNRGRGQRGRFIGNESTRPLFTAPTSAMARIASTPLPPGLSGGALRLAMFRRTIEMGRLNPAWATDPVGIRLEARLAELEAER